MQMKKEQIHSDINSAEHIMVCLSASPSNVKIIKTAAKMASAFGGSFTALYVKSVNTDKMDEFDAIAFGCPSMGAEQLEEDEFEPMFTACEAKLSGKKIALFGSYGWGDGEWMRNWDETCRNDGAVMACDFVICNDAPDEDAKAACEELGKALA